jgi:hypothetical protein
MSDFWGNDNSNEKLGYSYEVWNDNNRINQQKALNEYNQRVADAVNNYYTQNRPGTYYFRGYDRNKEYDDIINSLQTQDVKALQNYLDEKFTGLGGSNLWTNNYWTGNELNDQTNNFISTQYNDALSQLDRAKNRGYLSTTGYNNAFNDLNNQMSAAKTTVGDISKGIIDDYIADLTNKAQGYQTDVANYNLNRQNTTNTDNWEQDFNNFYNNQKEGLDSKFNLATNGLNLFDTADLIGNARVQQGVSNEQTNDLYNAIDEQNQKKFKRIGLGNAGLF